MNNFSLPRKCYAAAILYEKLTFLFLLEYRLFVCIAEYYHLLHVANLITFNFIIELAEDAGNNEMLNRFNLNIESQ